MTMTMTNVFSLLDDDDEDFFRDLIPPDRRPLGLHQRDSTFKFMRAFCTKTIASGLGKYGVLFTIFFHVCTYVPYALDRHVDDDTRNENHIYIPPSRSTLRFEKNLAERYYFVLTYDPMSTLSVKR